MTSPKLNYTCTPWAPCRLSSCTLCLLRGVLWSLSTWLMSDLKCEMFAQLFWFTVLVGVWQIWHFDVTGKFYLHEVLTNPFDFILHFKCAHNVSFFLRASSHSPAVSPKTLNYVHNGLCFREHKTIWHTQFAPAFCSPFSTAPALHRLPALPFPWYPMERK